MLRLVTGGSGSGKSAYGEELILSFGERKRYYIATMKPWDEECRQRIRRHQKMRKGKGFETAEQYTDVDLFCPEPEAAVLLECLSNLAANEFFREEPGQAAADVSRSRRTEEKLVSSILDLAGRTAELVVITNEVFSDGGSYDRETEEYLRLLGRVNARLAAAAGQVTEVVFGIPVMWKTAETQAEKRETDREADV